jgi:hypothetical protein
MWLLIRAGVCEHPRNLAAGMAPVLADVGAQRRGGRASASASSGTSRRRCGRWQSRRRRRAGRCGCGRTGRTAARRWRWTTSGTRSGYLWPAAWASPRSLAFSVTSTSLRPIHWTWKPAPGLILICRLHAGQVCGRIVYLHAHGNKLQQAKMHRCGSRRLMEFSYGGTFMFSGVLQARSAAC